MSTHNVDANSIELEFTESAFIRRESHVINQLTRLRNLGIELAIDDFGTGYSSFSYLRKLPAQVVKLDQSFVRTMATDAKGPVLVSAMVCMSHDLGYRVVAEGVESQEVFSMLKGLQCDEIQGYFVARPLPVEQVEEFFQRRGNKPGDKTGHVIRMREQPTTLDAVA